MAELIKKINGKEVYANRVDNDQNGDNIVSTYAKKTEIPSVEGLASVDYVDSATSGKLDTSAFDREITAYALKSEVPSIEGLMEESKLEYKNNQITGYNGSAFAGQGSAGHEYTGDSNILVDNDSDEISLSTSVSAKEIKVYNSNGTVNDTIKYGGYSLKSAPAGVNAPSANYGVNGITIYGIQTKNAQSSSAINLTSGSYSANLSIKGLKGRGSNAEFYSLNPSGMKVISGQQNIYAGSDGLVFTDFVNNETIKLTSAGVQETYYDGSSTKTIALRDINKKLDTTAFDAALDVLMSEAKLEYDNDVITGYNGSAFAGIGGHEYTGIDPIVVDNDNNTIGAETIELVAGDGIDITDGVISCTGTSIDYNIVIEDI